jgi:hypothetical protein
MARINFVLKMLEERNEAIWKPKGNSMTPKIDSGDQVKVITCSIHAYRVGDAVYAKVKGSYYLHLLTAIDTSAGDGYNARYQISNNHGHVNGWTDSKNMFGICVQVKNKVILTHKQIADRVKEKIKPSPQVGDKVIVPMIEYDGMGNSQKIPDLLGAITRISGGYHYVKIENNNKYDVLELYETEFKIR